MNLTAENYYTQEANKAYFSVSQIKAFLDCESRAVAELNGDYERPASTALLVGGFIDAYFSGELEAFKLANPEIFTKKGELRADYAKAQEIIDRIEREELAGAMLSGEKQKIVTGRIGGHDFKAKLDCYLNEEIVRAIGERFDGMGSLLMEHGAIVDLKIMKDFEPMYKAEEGRVSFIEYWGYDLQMAVYQELMRQTVGHQLPCFILAASKQDPPDITLVQIPQDVMDYHMERLRRMLPGISAVKDGEQAPYRCGKCAWCRQTKRLEAASILGTEEYA